jgi:hypothetical protein
MKKLSAVLAMVALASLPSIASAQRFGAHVNWGLDSELGLGGRYEHDLTNTLSKTGPLANAFFIGQVDYYLDVCADSFTSLDCTMLEINPGLAINLNATNLKPYVGAGLNIARVTVSDGTNSASNTETGINLLGGLKFGLGGMSAFSEARLSLGGSEQLALSFGLLFGGSKTP